MMIHMVSLSGTRLTSIFEVFDVNVWYCLIRHLWPLYPRRSKDGPDRWRPMTSLFSGIESQKSEHDSRWGISSATTLSNWLLALDQSCSREVVLRKVPRKTRPYPLQNTDFADWMLCFYYYFGLLHVQYSCIFSRVYSHPESCVQPSDKAQGQASGASKRASVTPWGWRICGMGMARVHWRAVPWRF